MKIAGIICELNPAHNGHKYIFEQARKVTGADYVVAVMSGDYVQRGEPALVDKHTRTKMALCLGADAVFELPTMWATGSAQYFARGAVSLLSAIGASTIVFGSECGDIDLLSSLEFTTPNDVLGSEYIKAIKHLSLDIKPYAITRIGTGYNDSSTISGSICSASYIREHLSGAGIDSLAAVMPDDVRLLLRGEILNSRTVSPDDISSQLYYKLNQESTNGFDQYFDVYSDLSDKLIKNLNQFTTVTEFAHVIKSKDIAFSHIKRAFLHILLGITNDDVNAAISRDYLTYIRLLGFKKSPSILSEIKKTSTAPIISKLADAHNILDDFEMQVLTQDIASSHLYSMLSKGLVISEYSRPIIIQ